MRNRNEIIIYFGFGAWLLIESLYGLLQIIGCISSNHPLFILTGHFNNPGPFGGFIAVLVSVSIAFVFLFKNQVGAPRWIFHFSTVAIFFGFLLLPASRSRSGWLGLGVSLLSLVSKRPVVKKWLTTSYAKTVIILLSIICINLPILLLKKESVLGRIHLWHMEILSINKHPWSGVKEGFYHAYGETQANYFASAERAKWEIKVAGSPEFAFNEYLKVGMEFGVSALLLFTLVVFSVCYILVRYRSPLGYGAITMSIFAVFSYPLSILQFQICGAVFFSAAIMYLLPQKRKLIIIPIVILFLLRLTNNPKSIKHDYEELYEKGYELYQMNDYKEAILYLEEGATKSCDPMFHNIIGQCYEHIGLYEIAEKKYQYAHYLVPGRIYPLVLLQELYISRRDTLNVIKTFEEIRDTEVNSSNTNMVRLYERAMNNMIKHMPEYKLGNH